MAQSTSPASHFEFLIGSALLLLLLLLPVFYSNHPAGTASGVLIFVVMFFFPGYLLLTLAGNLRGSLRIVLSPIFGIACVTMAYDIFARASIAAYFPWLIAALSIVGMVLLVRQSRHPRTWTHWTHEGYETVIAGCATTLSVAALFWRSGRFSSGELVFYGPAGHDHLYHLTLLQRLLHHVPPDNFIFSGLRAPVYHYFDDLALALLLRAQNALHFGSTDVFDLYYRCYPTAVYFLLGALAYRSGRQLLGSARGGILGLLLLLGAGGLGWFFGLLQILAHARQFAAMRAVLFTDWTSWDGIDSILPLVHRPAHYHSLLLCLAAINILLRTERSRRDWMLAGLLLGLMAGFNFTLAATFGLASVCGSVILFLQRRQSDARDLAWLALFIFAGSLPVITRMLLAGFHNPAPGFPFSGPNLEFSTAIWGTFLERMMPETLVPWVSLIVFPIVAYGVKLFGLGPMARLHLGEDRHRPLAMVFALVFALSFVIGAFFPYQAFGGVGIVFLQPTLWILGLFSLRPINAWIGHGRGSGRAVVLWGILGLTWVQAFGAFNFSHKIAFGQDAARALQDIHLSAAPDDVVAYLPSEFAVKPIWGLSEVSTNFAVTALTGLDGYFSSETYSKFNAVPGLTAGNPAEVLAQAQLLYEQRRDDLRSFVKGDISDAASVRLTKDHVRWIVVSGDAVQSISTATTPWRKSGEVVVYRFTP